MLWSPALGPNLTYALLDPKSHHSASEENLVHVPNETVEAEVGDLRRVPEVGIAIGAAVGDESEIGRAHV